MSGNTIIDMPCAACALPATSPSVMKNHVNANPNSADSASAIARSAGEPSGRKPTAYPTATEIAMPHSSERGVGQRPSGRE